MQKGAPIKIPLTVDLHITGFSGGNITRCESCMTNMVIDLYADGRPYTTQRPGINMFEDASATVADARGRGVYYWNAVSDEYIVNHDTVYKSSYSGSTMTMGAGGTERVFMGEAGDSMIILDQENNQGWYIASGSPTTLTEITDTDFPPKQTPALELCRGGAVINGKAYAGCKTGEIYESDIEDVTSWQGLSFREAELKPDNLVAIMEHEQHIAAFGTASLEFLGDAGNPVGSTLSPRTDIDYSVGLVDEDGFWQIDDDIYFVGQDADSNAIGVYRLSHFVLQKVSDEDLDSFLTTAINVDGYGVSLCGFVAGGRVFCSVTVHSTVSDISATETLVYVGSRPFWGFWDVQLTDVDLFPLVSWMPSTTSRNGTGQLANGDLITVLDDFNPVDTIGASGVYESGVYEQGVYSATGGSGTSIPVEIITGQFTGDTPRRKRSGELWLEGTPVETSQDMTIATCDDDDLKDQTFTDWGTIDVSDIEARLNRGGAFRRRNIKLSGTFDDQLRLENLRTTARVG